MDKRSCHGGDQMVSDPSGCHGDSYMGVIRPGFRSSAHEK